MKILVSGDRKWNDVGLVREILQQYDKDKVVICYQMQSGAALVAKVVAEDLHIPTEIVEGLEGIDYLLVFHKYIRGSVQSKILIKEASGRGIPYQVIGSSF